MAAPTLVDNAVVPQGLTNGSEQKTDNLTLTAGADFMMYHASFNDATQQNIASVSFNGVALTQVPSALIQVDATSVSRGWPSADHWWLVNQLTGAPGALLVTMNSGNPGDLFGGYSSWSGVDPTTPVGTATTVTGTVGATSLSIAPATTTDDIAVALMTSSADALSNTGVTVGTELWEQADQLFGTNGIAAYAPHAGGVSTTITFSKPGGTRRSVATAVAIKPTAAGGAEEITADLSVTEGEDSVSAAGALAIAASASLVEDGDTVSSAATLAISANLSAAEDADGLSADASLAIAAALAAAEGDDQVAASAGLAIAANLSVTEEADTLSSSAGAEAIQAELSATEQDDSIQASASLTVTADATPTEGDDQCSGEGTVAISASASITEQDDVSSSSAALAIVAEASMTEGDDTLSGGWGETLFPAAVSSSDARRGIAASNARRRITSSDARVGSITGSEAP